MQISIEFLFKKFHEYSSNNSIVPANFWNLVHELWSMNEPQLTYNAVRNRFRRKLKGILSGSVSLEEALEDSGYNTVVADIDELIEFSEVIDQLFETNNVENNYVDDESEPKFSKDEENDWIFDKDYVYNEDEDLYLIYSNNAKQFLRVDGKKLRGMKEDYSNWGGEPSTLNQIARKYGIPRKWFIDIKTAMGFTHDSEPYTNEEILENDDDTLVERALENRKRSIYQKFERRQAQMDKEDADKWRNLELNFLTPILDEIRDNLPTFKPYQVNINVNRKENYGIVFAPFDLHVGKLAYDAEFGAGSKNIAHYMGIVERLFEKVLVYGVPEMIITPCGSDYFHFDNMFQTTTKGTPQGNKSHSGTIQTVVFGYELAYHIWDFLCSLGCKVVTPVVSGNHDHLLSISLGLALKQRYKDNPNMDIFVNNHNRQYVTYGKSLLGFTHGENLPSSAAKRKLDLTSAMLIDAKKHQINTVDIDRYIYFSGHLHKRYYSENEDGGVIDIILPSLSETDIWHHMNGYEGNDKSIGAYRIHPEQGYIGNAFEVIK